MKVKTDKNQDTTSSPIKNKDDNINKAKFNKSDDNTDKH